MTSPGKASKWPKIASQLKTVAERELTERESRKGTYTDEMPRSSQLPPERARELSDFLFEYRKGWTVQRGQEIVAKNLIVKEFYEFLVPDHVSEKDFWERYSWRCDKDRIRKELEALPQDEFEKLVKQASKQQEEEEPSRVWALPDKKKAHIPEVVMPPPQTTNAVYDRSLLLHKKVTPSSSTPPRPSASEVAPETRPIYDRSSLLKSTSPAKTPTKASEGIVDSKPVYDRSILRKSSRMIVQDIEDSTALPPIGSSQLEKITDEVTSNPTLPVKPVYDRSMLRKSSRKIVQDMQDIEDSTTLTTFSQVDESHLENILHEEKSNQPVTEKPVYDRSTLKSSQKIVQDLQDNVEDSAGLKILSPDDSSQREKIMHEEKANQQLTGKDPDLDPQGETPNLSEQDLGEVAPTHDVTSSATRITTNDVIEKFPMNPTSIGTDGLLNEGEDVPPPTTTTRITTNGVIEKSPTMNPKSIETEQRPSEGEDVSTNIFPGHEGEPCESLIVVPTLELSDSLPPMITESADVAVLPDPPRDGLELQLNATPPSVPDQEKSLARPHEAFLCP